MPIELDRDELFREAVEAGGGHYIGYNDWEGRGGIVWFTDPVTKSSLTLDADKVTPADVWFKICDSRKKGNLPTPGPEAAFKMLGALVKKVNEQSS